MTALDLQSITNFRQLADDLITSGQPTEEQLAAVAAAGFEVVINLTLHDERGVVERLGMIYEHIPVAGEKPTHDSLARFIETMARRQGRRLYIHCAANRRVSAFMALYRVLRLGWRYQDTLADLYAIWQPNPTWQAFIEQERLARDLLDVRAYNRAAWNREVAGGNQWTVPVSPEVIAAARGGEWSVLLTPIIPVPRDWFGELRGKDVLCLACGGGQQGPIFAAAGANVTVFDNSPAQLGRDREVAEREGLTIATVAGDMADLRVFPDASFDLIFHPVSNVFAADPRPVWREAHRALRRGGALLAGFDNPDTYIFDFDLIERERRLAVRYALPYSDVHSLSDDDLRRYLDGGWPLEFSHTLDAQIGGQLAAGFQLAGFYEDRYPPQEDDLLSRYMPTFFATRAIKP